MIAAVLTFALVGMFALAGCSSNATEESTAESSSSATAGTEESSSEAAEAVELQIFAANSLSEAMDKVQELYSETHEGVTFADTQYEASGTLNEMLAAGSYADILITASKGTMDTAVEEAYVDEGTRFDMFTNDLVIVAGENSDITEVTLDDVATGQYTVAVGDDNVPAGNYAKQALSTVGCWVDEEGTTGSESDGKGGTFDGTPLAGLVTEGSSVGNVCSYANSRRRGPRLRLHLRRLPFRWREDCGVRFRPTRIRTSSTRRLSAPTPRTPKLQPRSSTGAPLTRKL